MICYTAMRRLGVAGLFYCIVHGLVAVKIQEYTNSLRQLWRPTSTTLVPLPNGGWDKITNVSDSGKDKGRSFLLNKTSLLSMQHPSLQASNRGHLSTSRPCTPLSEATAIFAIDNLKATAAGSSLHAL